MKVGDKAYIIESGRKVREVELVGVSGGGFIVKFADTGGGICVNRSRLYKLEEVEAKVVELNAADHKISLSMKALLPEPEPTEEKAEEAAEETVAEEAVAEEAVVEEAPAEEAVAEEAPVEEAVAEEAAVEEVAEESVEEAVEAALEEAEEE